MELSVPPIQSALVTSRALRVRRLRRLDFATQRAFLDAMEALADGYAVAGFDVRNRPYAGLLSCQPSSIALSRVASSSACSWFWLCTTRPRKKVPAARDGLSLRMTDSIGHGHSCTLTHSHQCKPVDVGGLDDGFEIFDVAVRRELTRSRSDSPHPRQS